MGAGFHHLIGVEQKSLRSTGKFVAARAATMKSRWPWNDGVSVSIDRHAAPPAS